MGKICNKALKITIKYLSIIIMIYVLLTMNFTCLANNENLITSDLVLTSRFEFNEELTYGCYIEMSDEYKILTINAEEFNLPSNLYNYRDGICLRTTYSTKDYKVYDCKVVSCKNGEIVEDLSEENLNRLFNIEYGKTIIEKQWVDKIKLSELTENEFYKYTANTTVQFPEIENDLQKNCIIYIKKKDNENYDKEINMGKIISGNGVSMSFNEYNSGESFSIMYKTIPNNELLNLIDKDDIIYLSQYKDGDKLEYQFEKYIYNDTENDITIHSKINFSGIDNSKSDIIPKDEIWGYDWMIDDASISYLKDIDDNKNQNSNSEEKNKNANINMEQTKETDVVNYSKLLKDGVINLILLIIIGFIIVILIIGLKRLKKNKNK